MPDVLGGLSAAEQQQAIAWLDARWGAPDRCPMHGGAMTWQVGPRLVKTVPYSGALTGGVTYPLVVAICSICGFTVFINAVKIGLVPGTPDA